MEVTPMTSAVNSNATKIEAARQEAAASATRVPHMIPRVS